MTRGLVAVLAWLAALSGAASAAECRRIEHDGIGYVVCEVAPAREELRLFLRDGEGTPWGQFRTLSAALEAGGRTLGFAMNAGMYHDDRSPVGLYVEDGREEMRVVPNAGPGNFGLLPNGVFCLREGRADVFETGRFQREAPDCRDATQSGPMLVIDGKLHPRFLPDSTSRYIRNGVGTSDDGRRAVFAISETPVTFHEFGRLYRDGLGLRQALYFDGNVSRVYAPQVGRNDRGREMGPIVGTVVPVE